MTRALLLAVLALLAACATDPTPEQIRAQCEAERTRRGISRLLPPEGRTRPECLAPGQSPSRQF
ncbi:hypothetical protein [Paracraurococcus lichenis]|uniref:Entry exclusion lipoprotein TrbK n=1 Tax=Paracraurococcus lichenis TaxID=3064888 RepID=A0ABT9DTY8_9PROT|nr:hypothetical protein [Paracraurococcus sp. LOR1-02]MDO9707362.1 hypothetical protein [Paracraurococcus sp. LOR1-02]